MRDIVERLRDSFSSINHEAATLIEALRKERDEANAALSLCGYGADMHGAMNAAIKTAVEQARKYKEERDELKAKQPYLYIGKDGRPILARDLEDQRDDALDKARLHQTDAAVAWKECEALRAGKPMANVEERVTYERGKLDEIVGAGGAHLESMGGKNWFLSIINRDGSHVRMWFSSKDLATNEVEILPARSIAPQPVDSGNIGDSS